MLSDRLFATGIRRAKIVKRFSVKPFTVYGISVTSVDVARTEQSATMLNLFEPLFDIPTAYYGALLGVGFCVYYLFEVVKVSNKVSCLSCRFAIIPPQIYHRLLITDTPCEQNNEQT